MDTKTDKLIKCKVKLDKQLFPKDKMINNGEFGIIAMQVLDTLEGEPQINKWGNIIVKGNMIELKDDEVYTITAQEVNNDKFGLQYELIFMFIDIKLNTKKDQFKFLNKILTEKQCCNIFEKYDNPIEILQTHDIEKLCKIKGIGVSNATKIIDKYEQSKDYSAAYIELDNYGLTNKTIEKLSDQYNSPNVLVQKIKKNPYILIDEVDGIGWSKADEIALKNGMGEYSVARTQAYIKYFLQEEAEEGNTWSYMDDLLDSIDNVIGYELSQDTLIQSLKDLKEHKMIWTNKDQDIIALMKNYNLEQNIAYELKRLNEGNNNIYIKDWEEKIRDIEKQQGWEYTEEQKLGIQAMLEDQIILIIGGAGTGKSTIVKGFLDICEDNYSFAQTALSGRAACNLTEVTGQEGMTIHRLLGFNPENGFMYNKKNPLNLDNIIIDEMSMPGASIFYKLIQAIKTNSKLIMLGDTGQLETIGIGNLMYDMIASGYIKVVNLTKIHRQAQKSAIITESKKVRESKQIIDKNFIGQEIRGELQDLELDIYDNRQQTHKAIIKHFKSLLSKVENPFDIQVIVPTRQRGESCTYYLNNLLQEIVMNTNKQGLTIGDKNPYTLFVGDKIINNRNNYKTLNEFGLETPIFNGDLGVITDIDFNRQIITVDFNTKGKILIPKNHLLYINLGYAITTHKLQGSSSDYIICGLDYSHYTLLNKEMVYTMLTRAKKYCVLCAENKALSYAISRSGVKMKQTFLQHFLEQFNNINKEIIAS